jgi:hypothetical protein
MSSRRTQSTRTRTRRTPQLQQPRLCVYTRDRVRPHSPRRAAPAVIRKSSNICRLNSTTPKRQRRPFEAQRNRAGPILRQYFPKGSDSLAGTPRVSKPSPCSHYPATEVLNWKISAEVFAAQLQLLEPTQCCIDRLNPSRRQHQARSSSATAAPARRQNPKVLRIASWMLHHPDSLTDHEQIGLKQVLASCRHLETTAGHVNRWRRFSQNARCTIKLVDVSHLCR